jgi:cell division protein FtsW
MIDKVRQFFQTARPDYSLVAFITFLSFFGLAMLLSASSYESEKVAKLPQALFVSQFIAFLIGFAIMLAASLTNYRYLRKLAWPLSIFSFIALLLVDFSPLGITAGGSQRWLNLGPLSFQPSELVKISVILLMADGLAERKWNSLAVMKRFSLCMIMAFLILKEPDLGTSVLVVVTCACMLISAGMNLLVAIGSAIVGLAGVCLSIMHNPYQLERFQGWLSPEKDPLNTGYNLLQSFYAIGSGGVFGAGYGASIQKLGYLPVSYADFIFAIICEELGLMGSITVIGCFVYLLWKGTSISLETPGNFGKLLGLGFIFNLTVQAIFNLSGVVGLLPVTGMPLPLISYGKTSIIVVGFMLGVIINLSRQKQIYIQSLQSIGSSIRKLPEPVSST